MLEANNAVELSEQRKLGLDWHGKKSFVLEVPLRCLRPSIIYSVPCDRIAQRAFFERVPLRICRAYRREKMSFLSLDAPETG